VLKKYFPFSFLIYTYVSFAQAPIYNWGLSVGGSHDETAYEIVTLDSSYQCTGNCPLIVVGTTNSNDGNICGPFPSDNDAIALNMTTFGSYTACNTYGGSNYDAFYKGLYVPSGSSFHKIYIGITSSNDGDVSGNHGGGDSWLVRTKFDNIINQKCIGGKKGDNAYDFIQMWDKGFMICGLSNSDTIDNQLMYNHGGYDGWITRTDSLGNILWSKQYGGSLYDVLKSIIRTKDGGFLCAGYTNSNDSMFSINHGAEDYWIMKIDSMGSLLWQKIYGGSSADFAFKLLEVQNNNILVSGTTYSFDGDVTGNHGSFGYNDAWVLMLDSVGGIIWEKCYGGSNLEANQSMCKTLDGNVVILSTSSSIDGDLTGQTGFIGTWIFKIDSLGNILWSGRCGDGFGGNPASSIVTYNSKDFFFINHPFGSGGDVSTFYGGFKDIWVASMEDTSGITSLIEEVNGYGLSIGPNPLKDKLTIKQELGLHIEIEIHNSLGESILKEHHASNNYVIDLSYLSPGVYFLKSFVNKQSIIKKIIKIP
jgi:hypothetical protein